MKTLPETFHQRRMRELRGSLEIGQCWRAKTRAQSGRELQVYSVSDSGRVTLQVLKSPDAPGMVGTLTSMRLDVLAGKYRRVEG